MLSSTEVQTQKICCMNKCQSRSTTHSFLNYFPFPKSIDLCMQWAQNCVNPHLLHHIAYGGAQPFLDKFVCSKHFKTSDFLHPEIPSLGLKSHAVPVANLCDNENGVVIKKEVIEDTGDLTEFREVQSEIIENASAIKTEPEVNYELVLDESVPFTCFADSLIKIEPLNVVPFTPEDNKTCRNKEETFIKRALEAEEQRLKRNRANALRNAIRRANESEEQRKARNEANARRAAAKRASETEHERKDRLYRNAVRAALRRGMETEDQQKERRRKNALRAAYRRSIETSEQRSERRLKDKIRSAKRRQQESELDMKIRKYNDAVRAAFRRKVETEEQKQRRKQEDMVRAAKRRSNETAEERAARLRADRERAAKRRVFKKIVESKGNIEAVLGEDELFNLSFILSCGKKKSNYQNLFDDDTSKSDSSPSEEEFIQTISKAFGTINQNGENNMSSHSQVLQEKDDINHETMIKIERFSPREPKDYFTLPSAVCKQSNQEDVNFGKSSIGIQQVIPYHQSVTGSQHAAEIQPSANVRQFNSNQHPTVGANSNMFQPNIYLQPANFQQFATAAPMGIQQPILNLQLCTAQQPLASAHGPVISIQQSVVNLQRTVDLGTTGEQSIPGFDQPRAFQNFSDFSEGVLGSKGRHAPVQYEHFPYFECR